MRAFAQKRKQQTATAGSPTFDRARLARSPVLDLQRAVGNQAVLGLLKGDAYSKPPSAKYAATSESLNNRSDASNEGKTGDNSTEAQQTSATEGGLTNPRFKGDPELEACYDRRRFFMQGSRGEAVAKIQSGITDYFAANPLPVYGVDGEFGSETRRAVMRFQQSVGFTDEAVDGIVGHDTLDKLDKEAPTEEPDKPEPKPEPKDPDEDCLGCKPIAKVTKKEGNLTMVFGLCKDDFDVFNTGAGEVTLGEGCLAQKSNTGGKVNFRSGTQSGPAWQTVADLRACSYPPADEKFKTSWEVGFIQTLESATFGAGYDNNKFTQVTNGNARDALNDKVPAPWYDNKGNTLGPQDFPPTAPMINDTPNVWFPITHPDTGKDFLRSACLKAKFNLWLVINKIGVTPTEKNVDFLYHWSINIDQSFSLSGAGAHPCNISQWSKSGTQTMSNKGAGRGSATLVWDKPIAKGSEKTDNSIKTDPCASSGQSKDQPEKQPDEKEK